MTQNAVTINERIVKLRQSVQRADATQIRSLLALGAIEHNQVREMHADAEEDGPGSWTHNWHNSWTQFHQWVDE